MALTRDERLKLRDEKVRELFDKISTKNPKWRFDAIIEDIELIVYLAPRTIEGILRGEGRYAVDPKPEESPNLFS